MSIKVLLALVASTRDSVISMVFTCQVSIFICLDTVVPMLIWYNHHNCTGPTAHENKIKRQKDHDKKIMTFYKVHLIMPHS